jgi:glutathione S-transferase
MANQMPQLHHFSLDPYCRRMRMALAEYAIEAELVEEKPWAPTGALPELNPTGLAPVLIEDDGTVICGAEAMTEYLEETRGDVIQLFPGNPAQRAEARRLLAWFDVKFYTEVTEPVLTEKVISRFILSSQRSGSPDMARVRRARELLKAHLDYVALLVEERNFLAGNHMTCADLAGAAHLSALDYLGDIPWADNPTVQTWYARIKSRPSFRVLLGDTIAGIPASPHYANLDF